MGSVIDNINIGEFLPKYLSGDSYEELKKELIKFPTNGTKSSIYTGARGFEGFLLQGDAINDVEYFHSGTGEKQRVPVILFTNTCDMSPENKRLFSSCVMFAPIMKLEKYRDTLLMKGELEKSTVENHIREIKQQKCTSVIYLPQGSGLDYEGIVFMDRMTSRVITEDLLSQFCKSRIFTLSDFGFYLFLLKISIHFSRIHERIDRKEGRCLDRPE